MSQWILKENGQIVCRTTLHSITDSEMASETKKSKRNNFFKSANTKLGPTLYTLASNQIQGTSFLTLTLQTSLLI